MTQRDIDREIQNSSTGRIMRDTSYSAFKVVVVLGATRDGRKVRVCPWSGNRKTFSGPQARDPGLLEPIDLDKLSARQRTVVRLAMDHIDRYGEVRWKNGAAIIGVKPWLFKPSTAPKSPIAGVIQLAPTAGQVQGNGVVKFSDNADGRAKLQKLNKTLGDFFFGRKR